MAGSLLANSKVLVVRGSTLAAEYTQPRRSSVTCRGRASSSRAHRCRPPDAFRGASAIISNGRRLPLIACMTRPEQDAEARSTANGHGPPHVPFKISISSTGRFSDQVLTSVARLPKTRLAIPRDKHEVIVQRIERVRRRRYPSMPASVSQPPEAFLKVRVVPSPSRTLSSAFFASMLKVGITTVPDCSFTGIEEPRFWAHSRGAGTMWPCPSCCYC